MGHYSVPLLSALLTNPGFEMSQASQHLLMSQIEALWSTFGPWGVRQCVCPAQPHGQSVFGKGDLGHRDEMPKLTEKPHNQPSAETTRITQGAAKDLTHRTEVMASAPVPVDLTM